ncbi:MAG TPA: hypothetical protein VHX16_02830 [Chloroflexota bacterium]|nr:hypothetical protein [Chloroflexota bacterium]
MLTHLLTCLANCLGGLLEPVRCAILLSIESGRGLLAHLAKSLARLFLHLLGGRLHLLSEPIFHLPDTTPLFFD